MSIYDILRAIGVNDPPAKPAPMPNHWLDILGLTPAPQQPQPTGPPPGRAPYNFMPLGDLTGSRFADTLRAIAGSPSAYSTQTHGLAAGEYYGKQPNDTIAISGMRPGEGTVPSYVTPSPHSENEWALAHEMGHKYAFAGQLANHDEYGNNLSKIGQAITDARGPYGLDLPKNAYAGVNRDEHAAQAFANAVNFLRSTDTVSPDARGQAQAAALLAKHEDEVRGTSGVVDDLLTKPIYARHPLNMARMAIRPDATAVRKAGL